MIIFGIIACQSSTPKFINAALSKAKLICFNFTNNISIHYLGILRRFGLQVDQRDKIQPRSGCHELLAQLKAQGYRCWLLTNADCAGLALKLETIELRPYFEVIISSEELGHAKEDAAFWQTLQQRHPFEPQQAVFVDDNLAVLDSAQRFGITHLLSILQPTTAKAARLPSELPYPALDQLTELLDYLARNTQVSDVKTA